jgi:hypothetical protein
LLSGKGIREEWWDGITYPSGSYIYTRNQSNLDEDWGTGHVINPGTKRYSQVWATFHTLLIPAIDGVHEIKMMFDDYVKLYLNGELKIDRFDNLGEESFSVTLESKISKLEIAIFNKYKINMFNHKENI